MDTLQARCACGAYVDMRDEKWRVDCTREDFFDQHRREGCDARIVSDYKPARTKKGED